jgi:hypothetical protein
MVLPNLQYVLCLDPQSLIIVFLHKKKLLSQMVLSTIPKLEGLYLMVWNIHKDEVELGHPKI